jgi:hypothetical protein
MLLAMSHHVNELNVGLQSSVTPLYNQLVDSTKIHGVCSETCMHVPPSTETA